MDTPQQTLRGRIDELTEELVQQLIAHGMPETGVPLVRRILEVELGHERLRPLIEASMAEPAEETLDRFVLSLDPESHLVSLACKN